MSSGAVFSLLINDGRADRLIMATRLLNERIRNVMGQAHARDHMPPTLADIERTHMLFVNAHFSRDMATFMTASARMRKEREERKRERERAKNARKKRNRRNRVRNQVVQLAHILPSEVARHVETFLQAS